MDEVKDYLDWRTGIVGTMIAGAAIAALVAGWNAPDEPLRVEAPRVIDGDTIDMDGTTVRLWGIDAPEIDTEAGRWSALALERIVGTDVVTCYPMETDKYGRTVARCDLTGAVDIACRLVAENAASDWPFFSGGFYEDCTR